MPKKAIIAGASGLIGSKLLNIVLLKPDYDEVLILVRKELSIKHNKLTQLIIDFDQLERYKERIAAHALFCCLGSTRKKTPDLADYRKIDHDYPLKLAKLARQNDIIQYHLVSAIGANATSSNFYSKMKGEVENDIKQIGLKCFHIYRPSLLTGDRKESRKGERIAAWLMQVINPFLIGKLKKYRSIPATIVALAMFKESTKNKDGVFIHPSDEIKLLV